MHNLPHPYRLVLWPLSALYGAIVRFRNLLYLKGVLKSTRPSGVRIISVGNLTVGGTGKTPVTIHLAACLKDRGMRVAILSRGYRRTTRGARVVSDGERLLMSPQEAGDEPCLMAQRLRGVHLVVSEKRTAGAELLKERFGPDVILLDDGFQHLAIKRDLDIVLIDGRQLSENPRVLPSGPLREPPDSLKRADIILFKDHTHLPRPFAPYIEGKPRWGFSYRAGRLLDEGFRPLGGAGLLKDRRVVAVCGIAEPDSFFTTLEGCGARVVERVGLPDHHLYTEADVATLVDRVEKTGAEWVLTTEKDGVKLKDCKGVEALPLRILTIDVAIEEEKPFVSKVLELSGIETAGSCDKI